MSEKKKSRNNIDYINSYIKENYARFSVSFRKEYVAEFKEACKGLGLSQREVFKRAMDETIEQYKKASQ